MNIIHRNFMKVMTMPWILWLLLLPLSHQLTIYQNAKFTPIDRHFTFANISSVASRNSCACYCFNHPLCQTAIYSGLYNGCTLSLATLNQGMLQITTIQQMNTVLIFPNKTLPDFMLITTDNETVYGIWNTTTGGDATLSVGGYSIGNYPPIQGPATVFDRDNTTKYVNFGVCNQSVGGYDVTCGMNTGLYVSLSRGPSLLFAFRFMTANSYWERDPMMITIEGSNKNQSELIYGSSWTLMYNGTSGLENATARFDYGRMLFLSNNTAWYSSYRLLIQLKRSTGNFVHMAAWELYGYYIY